MLSLTALSRPFIDIDIQSMARDPELFNLRPQRLWRDEHHEPEKKTASGWR